DREVGAEEGGEEHRLGGDKDHHAQHRPAGLADRALVSGQLDRAHRSASAAWVRACSRASRSGRLERTSGSRSKLCGGGGELVAHSRVLPCQGSAGAVRGRRRVTTTLTRNTASEAAITNEPAVASWLRNVQPRSGR